MSTLPFKMNFKKQFKQYMNYSRKWFLFSIIIGVFSGILMALFTALVVNLQIWLNVVPVIIRYPIVGGVTSLLLYLGFKEVKGAGISNVLAHKNSGTIIPSRTLITKFLASSLTLGVGAPAGREGPSMVLGSTLSAFFAKKMKYSQEDHMQAITIGAAACTSAVFQTPLGGALFAAEVPYKQDLDETVILPALLASAIALLISETLLTLLNSHPIHIDIEIVSIEFNLINTLHFMFLGLLAGIIGVIFSILFKSISKIFGKYIKEFLLPFVGMIITAIIVIIFEVLVLPEGVTLGGTGFGSINALISSLDMIPLGTLLLFLFGIILATSTCVGLGASGGIMGPSLAIGAALGAVYAKVFPSVEYAPLIIIGMSSLHAATTKTPIASIIIILEMVDFPTLIIPLIISNCMAFIVSLDFSLYSGQIRSKEVILRRKITNTDILETIMVKEAMEKVYPTAKKTDTIQESFSLLYLHKINSLFVIDDEEKLIGTVSSMDFQTGFLEGKKYIEEIMSEKLVTAYEDENLAIVFERLRECSRDCIPVVDKELSNKILGYIDYNHIAQYYEAQQIKMHSRKALTIEEISNDDFTLEN